MNNTSKAAVAVKEDDGKTCSSHFQNMRYRVWIQFSHLLEDERYDDACKLAWAAEKVASI